MALYILGHVGLTAALGELLSMRQSKLRIDYRLLILGSLLPDIIDKPLAVLFGIEGRSVAHTLLFNATLTMLLMLPLLAPQIYPKALARRLSNPLPILSLGLWTHLLFDRIWEQPRVLLWPIEGVAFQPGVFDLLELLMGVLEPFALMGEIAGSAVLLFLVRRYRLHRWANLARFIRTGRVDG
jgi:hypothetical protein